jgi:hypothetical protein
LAIINIQTIRGDIACASTTPIHYIDNQWIINLTNNKGIDMEIEKTINIKFTDEELTAFIADRVIDLKDDETWELVNSYTTINNYTFKIVKKCQGDTND